MFRNRNAGTISHTEGKCVRTKGENRGTVQGRVATRGSVRPLELFFLGAATSLLVVLPAGQCDSGTGGGGRKAAPTASAAPAPTAPANAGVTPAAASFAASVRPVLLAHCAPCHEPGGKMYARLPFDDPTVIAGHSAGVLRRLKGEDRETVEKWLATLPAKAAAP
jgi:hypothetical protein